MRSTAGGVGDILSALRQVGERVGFDRVTTDIGVHPKARMRSTFATGGPLTIKVEINTFERSPARPVVARDYRIDSPWFNGHAAVAAIELAELIATKIRALFQRKKGRDLFDLWLAVRHAGLSVDEIAACFEPYRPDGWSAARALANLHAKLDDDQFAHDLDALINTMPAGYTLHDAAGVAEAVIASLDN